MFRMWIREFRDGHLLRDTVVEDPSRDTRTHKVIHAVEEGCRLLDLAVPLWLDSSIRDFQRHARCRFTQDAFMEAIEFDYLEIWLIEEDD